MGVSICGFKLVPWYFVQELKIKTTFQCLNWIIEQQESAAAKLSFKWSGCRIWSTDFQSQSYLVQYCMQSLLIVAFVWMIGIPYQKLVIQMLQTRLLTQSAR